MFNFIAILIKKIIIECIICENNISYEIVLAKK